MKKTTEMTPLLRTKICMLGLIIITTFGCTTGLDGWPRLDMVQSDEITTCSTFVALLDGEEEYDIDTFLNKQTKLVVDMDGYNFLHHAAEQGHAEGVQKVLEWAQDRKISIIDSQTSSRETALHLAAYEGNKAIVDYLLKQGARVDLANENGGYAIHYAVRNNHKGITAKLIEKIETGQIEKLVDKNGLTLLHLAAMTGDLALIAMLLKECSSKAMLNAKDNWGNTALHVAAGLGHEKLVAAFISNGADTKIKNNYKCTAADVAKVKGHTAIVDSLAT